MKFKKVLLIIFICSNAINLSAGAWIIKQNQFRLKASSFIMSSSYRYYSPLQVCFNRTCNPGEKAPFIFEGKANSVGSFLQGIYGINKKSDIEFMIPYYYISYIDQINPDRPATRAVGDFRVNYRYNLINKKFQETILFQIKSPLGFYSNDVSKIPVGDGQWDITFLSQSGISLWPKPAYINWEIGMRYRFKPKLEVSSFAPGNELVYSAEIGWEFTENFWIKNMLTGWYGFDGRTFLNEKDFLPRSYSARKILYYQPGIYFKFKPRWALELSDQISLAGLNMPAGHIFGIGLTYFIDFKKKSKILDLS